MGSVGPSMFEAWLPLGTKSKDLQTSAAQNLNKSML